MVKSSKTQRLREKVRAEVKYSKQTTLGSLPEADEVKPTKPALPERKNHIEITKNTIS